MLRQRQTIYLFDCGGANQPEPKTCNASTIVVSTPDQVHYSDWVKQKRVFTMPVWSAQECAAVVPAIYPQSVPHNGSDGYAARFKLHGGTVRTIFSIESSATLKAELDEAISGCSFAAVLESSSEHKSCLSPRIMCCTTWLMKLTIPYAPSTSPLTTSASE